MGARSFDVVMRRDTNAVGIVDHVVATLGSLSRQVQAETLTVGITAATSIREGACREAILNLLAFKVMQLGLANQVIEYLVGFRGGMAQFGEAIQLIRDYQVTYYGQF